jgi:probable addiction module antidote protein
LVDSGPPLVDEKSGKIRMLENAAIARQGDSGLNWEINRTESLMPDDETPPDPIGDYAIAGKLTEAFANHQQRAICAALMEAVRARGVEVVARQSGVSRTAIHAALVRHCNPQLSTILALTRAVGLQFFLYPMQGHQPDGPGDRQAIRDAGR